MAFNGFLNYVGHLVSNDSPVDDSVPCKADILSLRECVTGDSSKCNGIQLDLMHCLAKYHVDATEQLRTKIGVARYNEYVKEMEDTHGKEKAAAIIAEPVEKLKDVEAARMLYRLDNNQHPRGAPKSKEDLAAWTPADQVRLEMGEQAWWDSVRVFSAEFGAMTADRLFGVSKEAESVAAAIERVSPGANVKENSVKALEKLKEVMEPVREAAPKANSVDEIAAAFSKIYPTEKAFKAKLSLGELE